MRITADRIKETSASVGVGPFVLAGASVGFRSFAGVSAVNDTFYYAIEGVNPDGSLTGQWEVGIGTYSAANTLTRTTVLSSSNANAPVNFAAGAKQVWIDVAAAFLQSPYFTGTVGIGAPADPAFGIYNVNMKNWHGTPLANLPVGAQAWVSGNDVHASLNGTSNAAVGILGVMTTDNAADYSEGLFCVGYSSAARQGVIGVDAEAVFDAPGKATDFLLGVFGYAECDNGNVALMAGLYAAVNTRTAGVVTINAGAYIESQAGIAGAGKDWGVYNLNDSNYFGPAPTAFTTLTPDWFIGGHLFYSKNSPAATAVQVVHEFSPGANAFGWGAYATLNSVSAVAVDFAIGIEGDGYHVGTGTVDKLVGIWGSSYGGTGAGHINKMIALYGASGVVTAPMVADFSAGLWLDDQAGAAPEYYGIYNLTTTNWHGPARSSLSGIGQAYADPASYPGHYFIARNPGGAGNTALTVVLEDNFAPNGSAGLVALGLATNAAAKSSLIGVEGDAQASGAGNISGYVAGVLGFAAHEGAGTTAKLASLYATRNDRSAGIVNLNAGVFIEDQAGVAGAGKDWGVYNLNNFNYFGPDQATFGAGAHDVFHDYWGSNSHWFASLNKVGGAAVLAVNENNTAADTTWGVIGLAIGTNALAAASVIGAEGAAFSEGAGNVGYLAGVQGYAEQGGAGTISVMASFYAYRNTRSAGTVNVNAGLYIQDQAGVAGAGKDFGVMQFGLAANYFEGRFVLANTPSNYPGAQFSLAVNPATISGGQQVGVLVQSSIAATAGVGMSLYWAYGAFSAINQTCYGYRAEAVDGGFAGTNASAFVASASWGAAAANAFAFIGMIAAGANKWNAYMGGTASNYFAGTCLFGSTQNDARLGQRASYTASANHAGIAISSYTATAAEHSVIDLNRSKSAALGNFAATAANDNLGAIYFRGADGAAFQFAAYIRATVDAAVSAGVVPGRLELHVTSAAGADQTALTIASTMLATFGGAIKVTGAFAAGTPPAIIVAANYNALATDTALIFNRTAGVTVTLPAPATNGGRWLLMKQLGTGAVISASGNVKPKGTDVAGTAILGGTLGFWALLVSDGANWVTMATNQ